MLLSQLPWALAVLKSPRLKHMSLPSSPHGISLNLCLHAVSLCLCVQISPFSGDASPTELAVYSTPVRPRLNSSHLQ